MKIHASQWHARLYRWSRDTWNTFRADCDWGARDNLCLYVRTIVLYAPIVIFVHIALLFCAGYVLVYYPVTRIGWTGFWYELVVVASIAGVVLLYKVVRKMSKQLSGVLSPRRTRRHQAKTSVAVVSGKTKQKGPSFFEVVFNFLVAVKRKACPTLEIVPDKQE